MKKTAFQVGVLACILISIGVWISAGLGDAAIVAGVLTGFIALLIMANCDY